ncbi:MAG: hypothetical protein RB292_04375 [Patescibacteria group bacterium]|jgi:hypothetical protein|nr:hypothetical protein [Patescibacteria group bacterium]
MILKQLVKLIDRHEWIFVGLMSLLLVIITAVPYIYGYLAAAPGYVYNGLHALSPGDVPVYYSYIQQVKTGNFLLNDLFTSEPQNLGIFNIWWFLVGLLTKFFPLSIPLIFQLSRLLTIPFFIVTAYLFLAYFFKAVVLRKLSLLILVFSSGLGFYFAAPLEAIGYQGLGGHYWWPIDLWLTEANVFNILYQTSHFIISLALTLIIFLLMLLDFSKPNIRYGLASGIIALVYFNFHPYYFPVIFGALGLYLFCLMLRQQKFLWHQSSHLILVLGLSLPSVLYHAWLIGINPVIAQRALQNITEISPWPFVLLGFGWLLPGFLLGLWFFVKDKMTDNRLIFLLCWLVVNVVLIYLPFPFHSRYTQGIQVGLVIFMVLGLSRFYQILCFKLPARIFNFWINNPALWLIIGLVFLMPSTIYSVARDFYYFHHQGPLAKAYLYLPSDLHQIYDYLASQRSGQVVLASEISSRFVPGFSGQTVYFSHPHETLFYEAKLPLVINFFSTNNQDDYKQSFLYDAGIDFVIYSEYEKQLGEFQPSTKNYLDLIVDLPKAQLYRVIIN